MGKARKKKKVISDVIDRTRAAEIFGEYAEIDNEIDTLNAEMDTRITAIRDKYQPQISAAREKLNGRFELLEHFAKTNPQLFKRSRTIGFTFGKLGFRKGMPKLKTLPGKTWKMVLEYLLGTYPEYVEKVPKIKKEELISKRKDKRIREILPIMGIEVVQDDVFFVEPKKEDA